MAKFLIEDIKVGFIGGGIVCYPVTDNLVTETTLRDTEDSVVLWHCRSGGR